MSDAEVVVLEELLRFALPRLLGWDAVLSP